MDIYTAAEQAYKNGYEKGSKETAEKILSYLHTYEMYFDKRENIYKITVTLSKSELKELNQFSAEIKE